MSKGKSNHPFTGKATAVRSGVPSSAPVVAILTKRRCGKGPDDREAVLKARERGETVTVLTKDGEDLGHPVAPADFYFVELAGDGFVTESEGGLYIPWEFNPGEFAQVMGKVASVPRRGAHAGIVPGVELAFSYLAVYDEEVRGVDEGDVFYPDESVYPGVQTWTNGKGHILERKYMNNDKWRGRKFVDELIVDQYEGDFAGFESWLEKNPFRERAGRKLNNVMDWGGRKYLRVHRDLVYGYRQAGEVKCVAPYYFCAVPETEAGPKRWEESEVGLEVVKLRKEKWAWVEVLVGHEGCAVSTGKWVYVRVEACPEYDMFGRRVLVVEQDQIMGIMDFDPLTAPVGKLQIFSTPADDTTGDMAELWKNDFGKNSFE